MAIMETGQMERLGNWRPSCRDHEEVAAVGIKGGESWIIGIDLVISLTISGTASTTTLTSSGYGTWFLAIAPRLATDTHSVFRHALEGSVGYHSILSRSCPAGAVEGLSAVQRPSLR